MVRDIDRRDILKGTGAAGLAGLAGCITQSPGTPTDTPGGGGGDDDGDGDQSTPSPTESSYTAMLGVLLPLTGDLASLGKPMRDGAILPVRQLTGGNNLQAKDIPVDIDLQVADTQTNPQAGIQAAKKLINAGYPMINGPASSGVNLQVTRQALIPAGVVGCSPSSTSPNVTQLNDNDLIFRTAPSDALQGKVMAQVTTQQLDNKSASVMYVNNDYGQALANVFKESLTGDYDGTIQEMVAFKKEKSSYTAELSTAMKNNPDELVVVGYPASGIQIFRDYYADYANTDTEILVTDGLKDGTLPDSVGNDMSNVYGTAPLPSGPGNAAFVDLYKKEFGRAPGVFNAHCYDSSAVLLLANIAAQKNDGAAVSEHMRDVANPNDGKKITAANLPEGIRMAANGETIHYAGASSAVDFDKHGDMKAVTYSFWKFNTEVEGNIETLKKINFVK